jgi:DNA mismatch repair protein MutL
MGRSRSVRLLDPHTVNQIAAGEVVERPASVVKELVENALDSGATRIDVKLVDAGRREIRVMDDGCGMERVDAETAVLRHATSKIRTADDLLRVGSFGFRGEALPSIASVARLTLQTGTEDGRRTRLVVDQGKMLDPVAEAGPKGTTVVVEDLFLSIPARLKFLKSDTTEVGACVEAVQRASLASTGVAFLLRHGNTDLVRTSGSGDLVTTVAELFGRETARALVPVDLFNGVARCHGLVSPPHFTKPTRSMQWLFVNGRPVRNRTLTAALDTAMRSLTPEKRYPVAVLMVEVAADRVDVNVSPSKSEVKFHQEGGVFDAVRRAVRDALLAHGMVPGLDDLARVNDAMRGEEMGGGAGLWPGHSFAVTTGRSDGLVTGVVGAGDVSGERNAPGGGVSPAVGRGSHAERFLDGLRVLGQVDDTFIIAENREGLLVIDQHVAHERVLYEMLRGTRGSGEVEVQHLLVPETLHLDRRAAMEVEARLDELAAVGFVLEKFGGDTFLVRGVPSMGRFAGLAKSRATIDALKDLVDELAEGNPHALRASRDDVLILCSCKMAIKAGDPLGHAEMVKLLEDLATTENPYLCPHGRPITLVLPKSDLMRKFHRA